MDTYWIKLGSIPIDLKVVDGLTKNLGVLVVFILFHSFNERNPVRFVVVQILLKTPLKRRQLIRLLSISQKTDKHTAMEQCLNKHNSAIMAIHIVPH